MSDKTPPEIYVWIVSQDDEHRIRKWDTKPFDEATHTCTRAQPPAEIEYTTYKRGEVRAFVETEKERVRDGVGYERRRAQQMGGVMGHYRSEMCCQECGGIPCKCPCKGCGESGWCKCPCKYCGKDKTSFDNHRCDGFSKEVEKAYKLMRTKP